MAELDLCRSPQKRWAPMRSLVLPLQHKSVESWNTTLMRMLEQSKMFDVSWANMPMAPSIPGNRRGWNFNIMKLDGVSIALDTWDDNAPTSLYHASHLFDKGACFADVKLILKIQYRDNPFITDFVKNTGIKVTPWTIFPSRVFKMGAFKWENKAHKYLVSTTGRNSRFGRIPWVEYCKKRGDCYVPEQHVNHKDEESIYYQTLADTCFGLVLKGLPRSDGKNRRETEWASCSIPLILNYQPTYQFPFKASEHYIYMTKPEQLDTLKDINPQPYSDAITQVYNDYFSPVGMAKELIRLVDTLL